ncbi:MAG: hypothetical protein ABIW17_07885 [Marmoricola sp.]
MDHVGPDGGHARQEHQLAVGPWIESAAYLASALEGPDLVAVAEGVVATVAVPPLVPFALEGGCG